MRELRFFRDSYPYCCNDDLAAQMGLSLTSMHRIAKDMGLKKNPDWEKWLRKVLGNRILAIKISRGTNTPKGYVITNSFRLKKGEWLLGKLSEERRAAVYEKIGKSRKALYRREAIRKSYGLKPLTKQKVGRVSKAVISWRFSAKKRGYLLRDGRSAEGMAKEVYYTDDTKRSELFEKNGAKYGFVILPIGEEYKPKEVRRLVEEGLAGISFE